MPIISEFKKFALRGNVVDMVTGVIIGTAFGKIISSLVSDIVMPPVTFVTSRLMGRVDLAELSMTLAHGSDGKPLAIKYGAFLSEILNFTIVAWAVFLMVKGFNRFHQREEPAPLPLEKKCPECFLIIPIEAKRCGHCTAVLRTVER